MLRVSKFWIIHRQSGVGIFEQTFKNEDAEETDVLTCDVDPLVIQGYLYAVSHLSTEITSQNIEFIQLQTLRFYYHFSPNFIFIIVVRKGTSTNQIKNFLETLQKRFEEKYFPQVEHGFNGDITVFRSFAKEIEEELQIETQYFQFLEKRSDQLQDLFKSAKLEWTKLVGNIIDHSQSLGAWIIKSSDHEPEVVSSIVESRSIQKQDPSEPKTNKSSWV